MNHIGIALVLAAIVGGCSAVDVGPELKLMNEATASTADRVLAVVNADPEGERQERLSRAAAATPPQPWTFAQGCGPTPAVTDGPGACALRRGKAWDGPIQADAIRRKLAVVSGYVDALSSMADATSDAALIAAYGTALASLGDLATAAEIASLQETVQALKEREAAVGRVATFVLANRRARLLKKTVTANRDNFSDVVQEIIGGLMNQTSEDETLQGQYLALRTKMTEAVVAGANGDTVRYRALLDEVDRDHGQYLAARNASIFAPLASLAATHEALARRLQRPATIEEIQTFTRALAELRQSLK